MQKRSLRLFHLDFLVAEMVKCLPTMEETRVQSLGGEGLLEKEMQPAPILLPGKPHEQTE